MPQHDKGKQHAKQRAKSKKRKANKAKKELSMRKYCEAILRVIELFCEGVYIKYMTEQKSDNSLKSVRNITQEY